MLKSHQILRCPECAGQLLFERNTCRCINCKKKFPCEDGSPNLLHEASHSPGFVGVMQRSVDTEKFIENAVRQGWQHALRSLQVDGEPDKVIEAISDLRVSWLELLDLKQGDTVVDLGSGTGGVAFGLAKKGYDVIAIDRSRVDSRFVSVRARQECVDNILSVTADGLRLPLADDSVSSVIVIGVLEWVPVEYPDQDPVSLQIAFLKDILRILQPGGLLYLSIENRYYVGYFLGQPEPHSRLPYASLMSPQNKNAYSEAVRERSFLEETHSLDEYFSILKKVGFTNIESYWPYPDYRTPSALISTDSEYTCSWFSETFISPSDTAIDKSIIYNFHRFLPGHMLREMVRDYAFIGKKP